MGGGRALTNPALALPAALLSSRLVSPSSSSSNFLLALPCRFSCFQQTQSRREQPRIGFIGLLVTLLPPNPFFSSACRLPAIRGPADDKVVLHSNAELTRNPAPTSASLLE